MQVTLIWVNGKATQLDILTDPAARARPVRIVCSGQMVASFDSSSSLVKTFSLHNKC